MGCGRGSTRNLCLLVGNFPAFETERIPIYHARHAGGNPPPYPPPLLQPIIFRQRPTKSGESPYFSRARKAPHCGRQMLECHPIIAVSPPLFRHEPDPCSTVAPPFYSFRDRKAIMIHRSDLLPGACRKGGRSRTRLAMLRPGSTLFPFPRSCVTPLLRERTHDVISGRREFVLVRNHEKKPAGFP